MFEIKDNNAYQEMREAFINSGNADGVEKFKGQIRAGGNNILHKGDHIDWPDKIEPLSIKIGTGSADAIIVKVTSPIEGSDQKLEKYMPFFPSSLTKMIQALDVDKEGKVIGVKGFKYAKGTAADWMRSKANLEADTVVREMVASNPKGLDVNDEESFDVYRYNSKDLTKSTIYTYDFTD